LHFSYLLLASYLELKKDLAIIAIAYYFESCAFISSWHAKQVKSVQAKERKRALTYFACVAI